MTTYDLLNEPNFVRIHLAGQYLYVYLGFLRMILCREGFIFLPCNN
jgi:hypothetical protein